MFSEKTARVILMSGARRREHHGEWLLPDMEAQNNRLDQQSSQSFFKLAQELSVPLVVMSRFAAREGHVPRTLFDVLAKYCGQVGQFLSELQRQRIQVLWQQATAPERDEARGNLPARCDRAWFLSTFCSGREPTKEDIWDNIDNFNIYSPMALLAVLPGVVRIHMEATPVTIRAATHQVIGWSADQCCVTDPEGLQNLLLRSIVYGTRLNVSEFTSEASELLGFDMSEGTLKEVLKNAIRPADPSGLGVGTESTTMSSSVGSQHFRRPV
jgi:hypothetical protein